MQLHGSTFESPFLKTNSYSIQIVPNNWELANCLLGVIKTFIFLIDTHYGQAQLARG